MREGERDKSETTGDWYSTSWHLRYFSIFSIIQNEFLDFLSS